MSRSNEAWVAALGSTGPEQTSALSDLRRHLLRGLRAGLQGRATSNDAFIEDAVQDAMVKILAALDQFQGRSRFVSWATAVAIRVALTELRRRRWKDVSIHELVEDPGGFDVADQDRPTDSQQERNHLVQTMRQLIRDELTDRQRLAITAELQGMPQVEVARQLGTNRNALYKLTHDARKRLKRALETAGYGPADIHSAFSR